MGDNKNACGYEYNKKLELAIQDIIAKIDNEPDAKHVSSKFEYNKQEVMMATLWTEEINNKIYTSLCCDWCSVKFRAKEVFDNDFIIRIMDGEKKYFANLDDVFKGIEDKDNTYTFNILDRKKWCEYLRVVNTELFDVVVITKHKKYNPGWLY